MQQWKRACLLVCSDKVVLSWLLDWLALKRSSNSTTNQELAQFFTKEFAQTLLLLVFHSTFEQKSDTPHRNCIARWGRLRQLGVCVPRKVLAVHIAWRALWNWRQISAALAATIAGLHAIFLVGFIKDGIYYAPLSQNLQDLRQLQLKDS